MKSLIFDAESVRQILAGAKTQSRRVLKPQPPSNLDIAQFDVNGVGWFGRNMAPEGDMDDIWPDPYGRGLHAPYQPGDRLYVKEAIAIDYEHGEGTRGEVPPLAYYRATDTETPWTPGCEPWKSPLFMPKWAARLWLEVTAVRVERVQDISIDDIEAEGVYAVCNSTDDTLDTFHNTGRFAERWNAINGRRGYSWNFNPWVWCISFRRI